MKWTLDTNKVPLFTFVPQITFFYFIVFSIKSLYYLETHFYNNSCCNKENSILLVAKKCNINKFKKISMNFNEKITLDA